jgi:hypothetical protein
MRILILLVLLLLDGCGKSEVDKCVEAFMKEWDTKCTAYKRDPKPDDQVDKCDLKGSREEQEAAVRFGCLKAAGKN